MAFLQVSVTFDSFMSVAVPLHPEDTRRLSLTLRRYNGSFTVLRVTVPLAGTVKDLCMAAAVEARVVEPGAAALVPTSLVCAEVYGSKLHKLFSPQSKLELIHDSDVIIIWQVMSPPCMQAPTTALPMAPDCRRPHHLAGAPRRDGRSRSGRLAARAHLPAARATTSLNDWHGLWAR